VKDRRSTSSHAAWAWPVVALALSLIGAAALCGLGWWSVTENYDGFTSFINIVAIGSCCAAVLLLFMAAPIAWFVHETFRDQEGDG
jgi:hypothetical protein